MKYAQRVGMYMRLRQELAAATRASQPDASYVARLRIEIAAIERAMALPLIASANAFLPNRAGADES